MKDKRIVQYRPDNSTALVGYDQANDKHEIERSLELYGAVSKLAEKKDEDQEKQGWLSWGWDLVAGRSTADKQKDEADKKKEEAKTKNKLAVVAARNIGVLQAEQIANQRNREKLYGQLIIQDEKQKHEGKMLDRQLADKDKDREADKYKFDQYLGHQKDALSFQREQLDECKRNADAERQRKQNKLAASQADKEKQREHELAMVEAETTKEVTIIKAKAANQDMVYEHQHHRRMNEMKQKSKLDKKSRKAQSHDDSDDYTYNSDDDRDQGFRMK